MSVSPKDHSASTYRTAALLCAVHTFGTAASRLLALHPRAAEFQLQPAYEGLPLTRILWQELIDEELAYVGSRGAGYIDPPGKTAIQYWQRRLRLVGWKQHLESAMVRPRAPTPEPGGKP